MEPISYTCKASVFITCRGHPCIADIVTHEKFGKFGIVHGSDAVSIGHGRKLHRLVEFVAFAAFTICCVTCAKVACGTHCKCFCTTFQHFYLLRRTRCFIAHAVLPPTPFAQSVMIFFIFFAVSGSRPEIFSKWPLILL